MTDRKLLEQALEATMSEMTKPTRNDRRKARENKRYPTR
jgi:hypothetical protein